jgi:hypothetical protein
MYDIEAKIILTNGEMIDISPSIRRFIFIQSITTKYPLYRLLISNQVTKYINTHFKYFYFNIKYKGHDINEYESYVFHAIPVNSKFNVYFTTFNQEEPYRDYVWFDLVDNNAFTVFSKLHKSKIYRHVKLDEILRQYVGDLLVIDNTFNQNVYDEIYIPTAALDNIIEYLDYHFGFYETNHSIIYRYNPKDLDLKLVIQDNKLLNKFDIQLYKIDNDDDLKQVLREEAENIDKLVVTPNPLLFDNELPDRITANKVAIIGHPLDKLYDKYYQDIKNFLDDYCPSTDSIDLEESNVTNIPNNTLLIKNHNRVETVKSLLSNEYFNASTCSFTLDNPRIRILAGHKVNVNVTNPELSRFTGTYVAEVVKYDFVLKDGMWKCMSTNILARTNPYTQGV